LPTSPVAPATTTFFAIPVVPLAGPATVSENKKAPKVSPGLLRRLSRDQFWLSPMIGVSLS
jgi:hypothetical protein